MQPFLYNIKKLLTNCKKQHIILYVDAVIYKLFRRIIMIFDKIKTILAEQLDVDVDELSLETDIARDLNADSLDVVEMLMAIDDEFGVEIPDEEVENIKTIGDLVEYIESRS